jgi:hypothetical protein
MQVQDIQSSSKSQRFRGVNFYAEERKQTTPKSVPQERVEEASLSLA